MNKQNNKYVVLWMVTFVTNIAVIYLTSLVFPENIVLGNAALSPLVALIINSLILTLVCTQIQPLIKALKLKKSLQDETYLSLVHAGFYGVFLWLLARVSTYTGLGVSSFFVVIILGLALGITYLGIRKFGLKEKKS